MLPFIIKDSALDEIQNAYDYLEEIGTSTPLSAGTSTPLSAGTSTPLEHTLRPRPLQVLRPDSLPALDLVQRINA